jgi:AcrR family transcriptional regulator
LGRLDEIVVIVEKAKKLVRRELVESELLERAADLFAERGFNGTTLQDVADTVGLTRAALYHYFESKEALLTTLVEGITAARVAQLKRIRRDKSLSATGKLERVTRMMVLNVATHAARFRLLIQNENELPPGLATTQARGRREVLNQIVELFEEGITSGEFKPVDPHLGAFALLGMCNWIAWWFKPERKQPAEAIADEFAGIALGAFVKEPDTEATDAGDLRRTIRRMREDLARLERFIPSE